MCVPEYVSVCVRMHLEDMSVLIVVTVELSLKHTHSFVARRLNGTTGTRKLHGNRSLIQTGANSFCMSTWCAVKMCGEGPSRLFFLSSHPTCWRNVPVAIFHFFSCINCVHLLKLQNGVCTTNYDIKMHVYDLRKISLLSGSLLPYRKIWCEIPCNSIIIVLLRKAEFKANFTSYIVIIVLNTHE